MKTSMTFAVLVLVLSACGQKGPLFLPGDPDEVQIDIPTTTEPAADDADEDQPPPR